MIKKLLMGTTAITFITACAFVEGPQSGVVVDMKTGAPLAGAVVRVEWRYRRANWAHSEIACFHVESVRADSHGKFSTPAWKTGGTMRNFSADPNGIIVEAFAPGYVTPINVPIRMSRLVLMPFEGTPEKYAERVHFLRKRIVGCGPDDPGAIGSQTLIAALDDEAKRHPYQEPPSICVGCGQKAPATPPSMTPPATGSARGKATAHEAGEWSPKGPVR